MKILSGFFACFKHCIHKFSIVLSPKVVREPAEENRPLDNMRSSLVDLLIEKGIVAEEE
jgi:hypothetical protein